MNGAGYDRTLSGHDVTKSKRLFEGSHLSITEF